MNINSYLITSGFLHKNAFLFNLYFKAKYINRNYHDISRYKNTVICFSSELCLNNINKNIK